MASERSVVIRLKGDVTQFIASMKAAGASAKANIGKQLDELSSAKKKAALNDLGNAAGKIGLAGAAGLGAIIATTANFDQAMSKVQAATHESTQNMRALREEAIKAGADTVFSASEAAAGIENLAKAGVSTSSILHGGLQGALDLAAAGEMDVADAAETAATAMTQFGLKGKDVPHIADLLSAAAGKAQGEVSDFAQALKQGGLVAHQTGLSIEETTGGLAAFASAGLIGSDAGTSFKTMLQSLTPSSEAAAKTMDALGINAYDTQGNFVGLAKYAGILHGALKDMSAEQRNATLKVVFGSDAVRAASVLYDQGAKGIQSWIDKTNDAGYASETAGIKLDNLKGDLEQLRGSLETALIGAGESSQNALRGIVQNITGAINAFNRMPEAVQGVATSMAGLTAIAGGGLFFGTKFVSTLATAKESLKTLGVEFDTMTKKQVALRGAAGVVGTLALSLNTLDDSADRATRTMGGFINIGSGALMGFAAGGPIGAAIGGGVELIMQLAGAMKSGEDQARKMSDAMKDYASTLDEATGATTELTRARIADRLESQGVLEATQQLGIGTKDLVDAIAGVPGAAAQLRAQLSGLRTQYEGTGIGAKNFGDIVAQGRNGLGDTIADVGAAQDQYAKFKPAIDLVAGAFGTESTALRKSTEATKRKAQAAGTAAGNIDAMGGAAAGATDPVTGLATATQDAAEATYTWNDALDLLFGKLDKVAASDNWKKGLKELGKDLKGGSLSLDDKKGADNRDVIRNRVSDLESLARAQAKQGVAGDKVVQTLLDGRDAIVKQATAAGVAKGDIEKYLKTLGLTPDNIATSITLNGVMPVEEQIKALRKLYDLTPKELKTIVKQIDMDPSLSNIKELSKRYDLTPKQVRTLIATEGIDHELGRVRVYKSLLDGLNGKVVNSKIKLTQAYADAGLNTKGGLQAHAEGGTIAGQRAPYGDKVLMLGAPGEEVISNRNGQADRWRPLLKAINANRFADGGTIPGFASRPAPVQAFANGGTVGGGGGRQVPLVHIETLRHNDMRETERWARQQSVHAGGGGVTF